MWLDSEQVAGLLQRAELLYLMESLIGEIRAQLLEHSYQGEKKQFSLFAGVLDVQSQ